MTKTEEVIKQLDGKLTAALHKGDSASVDALLADNYVEVNAQGQALSKSDVLTMVRARASVPRSTSIGPEISEETKIHVIGETAIIIGLKTTKYPHMEYQTVPQPVQTPAPVALNQERFIKVYVKVSGHWQLVAFQTTLVVRS